MTDSGKSCFLCPYCGTENTPDYQFCVSCGHRFDYRCPECGTPVAPSTMECPGCASGLHWAITGTESPPPTPSSAAEIAPEHKEESRAESKPAPAGTKPKKGPAGLWIMFFGTTFLVAILIIAGLFLFSALPWGLDRFVPSSVQTQTPPAPSSPASQDPGPPPVLPVHEPDILSFDVSPTIITSIQEAVLSWEVEEADRVTIDGGIGEVEATGTEKVAPAADTVYTLTAENAAGNSTRTVQLLVMENIDARAIALTEDDVEGTGFTYKVRIAPSIPNTISTHEVQFTKGYKLIDNKVLIFETVQQAEQYYFDVKNNNRVDILEQPLSIGARAFVLHYASEYEDEDMVYTIKFQKNNVFISMGRLDDFELLEQLSRVVESRID